MYSIYSDGVCIYSDRSTLTKYKVSNPKLTLEDNSAGSLEFTLPPINVGYDSVKRLTSEIIVYKDDVEIWSGRALTDQTDFYKNKLVYCEGELAYLNDSIQPPAEYHNLTPKQFLETLISIHNSQVESVHHFTVGVVTVTDDQTTDDNDTIYRYTNYESTMNCIQNKLIDRLGGHVRVRKVNGVRYIDYLKDWPNVNSQKIEFGKNLLDFSKNFDATKFITVLVPQGAAITCTEYSAGTNYDIGDYCYYGNYIYRAKVAISNEVWTASHWTQVQKYISALTPYLTVEEVNNGSIYVGNTEAIQQYGRIVGVYQWNNVTEASNLLTKAQKYLSEIQFDNMVLEVSAIDLHYMDINTEAIRVQDQIRVVSYIHGLDRLFPVSKLTIPLNDPSGTTFTLGDEVKSSGLSASTSQISSEIIDKIEALPPAASVLDEAVRNATSLITMATNGYITITKGPNGTSELYISNEKDYTKSTKLWRWNINGLGYSNDGGQTYGLAMTMDGSIVANYVTTGTMLADRIKGGTLEVGGTEVAKDGSILVKDSSGRTMISISKYGMTLYDESGNGKAYLDHSGLTMTGGTVNASTINGAVINSSCKIQTDKFSLNENGDIYNWGSTYSENEGSFKRAVGRVGVISYGDLYVSGSKDRIVETENNGYQLLNAYETPTPYFGDIGEGKTDENGICVISIDPMFREVMDESCNYQVFLQAYTGGHLLQVSERRPDSFTVEGDINTSFGWEIKAVQKDFNGIRFPEVDPEIIQIMEQRKE